MRLPEPASASLTLYPDYFGGASEGGVSHALGSEFRFTRWTSVLISST